MVRFRPWPPFAPLKNRGVQDVLVTLVDGPKGFPEAISAVFPLAQVQTGIVHLIRHSWVADEFEAMLQQR